MPNSPKNSGGYASARSWERLPSCARPIQPDLPDAGFQSRELLYYKGKSIRRTMDQIGNQPPVEDGRKQSSQYDLYVDATARVIEHDQSRCDRDAAEAALQDTFVIDANDDGCQPIPDASAMSSRLSREAIR